MTTIDINFSNENFIFKTGPKVFSPDQLDEGSRLLLETVTTKKTPPTVIDIGCGYGVMGIILAKLSPASKILMIDNDPYAISLARENSILNHTPNAQVFKADVTYHTLNRQFDLAVSNPPWSKNISVIPSLIKFAFAHLKISSKFFIVVNQTFRTEHNIESFFGNVAVAAIRKPYKVIQATKL